MLVSKDLIEMIKNISHILTDVAFFIPKNRRFMDLGYGTMDLGYGTMYFHRTIPIRNY